RDASPAVTAARPDDLSPDMLRHMLKKEFNLIVAGGQNDLKGKLFRIGHMGYCSPADILQTISIIELALHKMGQPIELGSGVQAAQKIKISGGAEEFQIWITDPISERGLDVRRKHDHVSDAVHTNLTSHELEKRIALFDGLLVRSQTNVTRRIIEKAKKLKIIGRAGVGVDNIDLDATTENGII